MNFKSTFILLIIIVTATSGTLRAMEQAQAQNEDVAALEEAAREAFPDLLTYKQMEDIRLEKNIEHNSHVLRPFLFADMKQIGATQALAREFLACLRLATPAGAQKKGPSVFNYQTYIYVPACAAVSGRVFCAEAFEFQLFFDSQPVIDAARRRRFEQRDASLASRDTTAILCDMSSESTGPYDIVRCLEPSNNNCALPEACKEYKPSNSWRTMVKRASMQVSLAASALGNITGEADHIWTAIFTGSDGMRDVVQSLVTVNPLTACIALVKLGVAYKSYDRARQALWQEHALTQLKEIHDEVTRVQDISSILAENFEMLEKSLGSIKEGLNDLDAKQEKIAQILVTAEQKQKAKLQEARALYDLARQESAKADASFEHFKKCNRAFLDGWRDIVEMFDKAASPLKEPFHVENLEQQLRDRMNRVGEQVQPIEKLTIILETQMEQLSAAMLAANEHRSLYNKYVSEASTVLLSALESNMTHMKEMSVDLATATEVTKQLKAMVSGALCQIAEVQAQNDELQMHATLANEKVVKADARVASMFESIDLLAGSVVAYGFASVAASFGVAPIVISGLLTAWLMKTGRNSCLGRVGDDELAKACDNTELRFRISRWAVKKGLVSEGGLKRVGGLVFDYSK
jgi:hypothetical protein